MIYLTNDEIGALKAMAGYWEEVSRREDKSPLVSELNQLIRLFGVKILFIVADYVKRLEVKP